jgi:hypothetical protein
VLVRQSAEEIVMTELFSVTEAAEVSPETIRTARSKRRIRNARTRLSEPNGLALLRKWIGLHVDADDGGVGVVVAENLAEIGSVGGHRFRSRLA